MSTNKGNIFSKKKSNMVGICRQKYFSLTFRTFGSISRVDNGHAGSETA